MSRQSIAYKSKKDFDEMMKAAVIVEPRKLELQHVNIPELQYGEALIKVQYCGICGSDIHVLHGEHATATFPRVPGHEFVGELVDFYGQCDFSIGDTVVAQPFFSCGNCESCAQGKDNVCCSLQFMGAHVDGAFAQYVKVLIRKMYKIPPDVEPRLASLVEPIAVAVHDVRGSGLQVGETALIIGSGPIGLLIAIVAAHTGARRVVISEINPYRQQVAKEMGFEVVDPTTDDFDDQINRLSDGTGFDVVFEVSGSKAGIRSSTAFVKNAGTVMIIGMASEPYLVNLAEVFAKEIRLKGVRIHSQYNFIGAVEILKSGVLNQQFLKLITNEFSLNDIVEAFEFAEKPGDYLKIIVNMED